MHNMGQKTVREVLAKLDGLRDRFIPVSSSPSDENNLWYSVAQDFSSFTGLPVGNLVRLLAVYCEDRPDADGAELCAALYRDDSVREEVCHALLRILAQREDGMSRDTLLERLPAHTTAGTLNGLLNELNRNREIVEQDGLVVRQYPTAMEYVQGLEDQRSREILLARLQGETLESLGKRLDITRERVRQITAKTLPNRPALREDRYQYLFEHYEFSREEFHLAFDEPDEVYHYLEMIRPKGDRKPIRELLADEHVSVALRRKAERAVYKQYVTIDGVRVLKSRAELSDYTVRTYCRELTSMDEFLHLYGQVLESVGLENDPSLAIEVRTYENRFSASNDILWNQRHRFRYYPIGEREYDTLLETLDLAQYEDVELSTLKLFRDYPELMAEYDIRDEYELHNLLRKIWPKEQEGDGRVRFKKMPTVEIGTPDRERQVMDLLMQYAPISNIELAQRYEEAYGIKSGSALANHFPCIDAYLHNGVYCIDLPVLPAEQRQRMAELLTRDFYRMAEVRRIYRRAFPGANGACLNPFTLKSLGFRAYPDYIVSNRFPNISGYIHHLLTGNGIADMRSKSQDLATVKIYWRALAKLKSEREIVEFEPQQYITLKRLQASGVSAADLEDYCAAVSAWVRPGAYFTVASLRQDSFTHSLDDLGFGDWFYGSLLAEDPARFSYRRMGGTRVFRRGRDGVQQADFLRWLLEAEERGRMDIYDLAELLEQRYGAVFQRHKLQEVIHSSDLYYDAIMEAAYVDYDTYLEEI